MCWVLMHTELLDLSPAGVSMVGVGTVELYADPTALIKEEKPNLGASGWLVILR